MSSEPAVVAEGLGKRYRLGQAASFRYRTLREELAGALRRRRGKADDAEEFWALRNVSFEVAEGEAVGIIGRNGAGKSTLLKILARITTPTAGRGDDRRGGWEPARGRHRLPPRADRPREHLPQRGDPGHARAPRSERKFDEIVEFSGLERFLDTPVKRYSSGMYVRLAFAVAAHLDPEILLVDEVLAVGRRRLPEEVPRAKMSNLSTVGRTVLFVSHSMPTVARFCPRVILLDRGGVVADGPPASVIGTYLSAGLGTTAERIWSASAGAPGDDVVRLRAVRVLDEDGELMQEVDVRRRVGVEIEYELLEARPNLRPFANLHFFNDQGTCLFVSADHVNREWWESPRREGVVRATCWLPPNLLAEGRVTVTAAVSTYNPTVVHAREDDAVAFMAVDRSDGDGARGVHSHDLPGVVRPLLEWSVAAVEPRVTAGGAVRP